jgi:hypothetical protein
LATLGSLDAVEVGGEGETPGAHLRELVFEAIFCSLHNLPIVASA